MTNRKPDEVRSLVRERYAQAALEKPASSCCAPSCCGGGAANPSEALGYSAEDLAAVPRGADLGLGCGNPQAIAKLRAGESVLDLGSGAGFDCFLAARQVGPSGHVYGVDMTPEMIARARENARKAGVANVEFRLGEIEHLPVADSSIDVILSNCVINLSPDKPQVFRDAFRVLRPGGRLAISDVVALAPLSEELQRDTVALTGCIAGAALVADIEAWLRDAGFVEIQVVPKPESREIIRSWAPGSGAEDLVASATIEARKPRG